MNSQIVCVCVEEFGVAGPGSSSIVCQCEVGVVLTSQKLGRRFSDLLQATSDLRGFRARNSKSSFRNGLKQMRNGLSV